MNAKLTRGLFTIGHSALPIDEFTGLLTNAGVKIVCDVRSSPFSRFAPQFNSQPLERKLAQAAISYKFLGKALGGRIDISSCYVNGRIDYSLVEKTGLFKNGVAELLRIAQDAPTAIMCSEKDPLNCHRYLLISKHLRSNNITISHILHSGKVEENSETESRLFRETKVQNADLFEDSSTLLEKAYRVQSEKVSFVSEDVIQ